MEDGRGADGENEETRGMVQRARLLRDAWACRGFLFMGE